MIPLTLPCDVDDADTKPFVARLVNGPLLEESDAILVGADDCLRFYQLNGNSFSLPVRKDDDYANDVIFVEPSARRAQRWIRAKSPHNTLLVTEQCDQLCVMCSQPPKKSHTDLFEYFAAACRLAPPGVTIGFSGGEPTLHKTKLFELLLAIRTDRPDLNFHVLTNAQHFNREDAAILKKLRNVLWGVPLYAAEPHSHDKIVGKCGAFEILLRNLALMAGAGAAIELRTVVTQQNAKEFAPLANLIVDRLSYIDVWAVMQLERIGFAKRQWNDLFFDHSKDFSSIGTALSAAMLHGVDISLYNFPLCTLPAAWRPYAVRSISDWKNKYLLVCDRCSAKSECAGFFEWHPDENTYHGVAAL